MRLFSGPRRIPSSEPQYAQHERNLNAGVLGAVVFALFQVWTGRIIPFYLVLAALCAVWSVVESARRPMLRRRARLYGPLSLDEMRSRSRMPGNDLLFVGPIVAFLLPILGGVMGGMRGAFAGAMGGTIYLVFVWFSERYPADPGTPAA